MENIRYFASKKLEEGDVFIADLYKENIPGVYLLLEKDIDEVFNVTYFTVLSDKGEIRLVNSNYINIKKDIKKIND